MTDVRFDRCDVSFEITNLCGGRPNSTTAVENKLTVDLLPVTRNSMKSQ